jgi:SAM-dependent methyltransferase
MTDENVGRDDLAHWTARYVDRGCELDRVPSPWAIERCLAIPSGALIVDIAGGSGRHALALAREGRAVVVVDFVAAAVAAAVARSTRVLGIVADVAACPIRDGSVDAILCVSFLDRSLFAMFATLLRPGGTLVYETFTRDHLDVVARGKARGPRSSEYLLHRGELPRLVAPLEVREYDERLIVDAAGERHVARVVALKHSQKSPFTVP